MQYQRKEIEQVMRADPWAFGNKVLYDLCENNPKHTDADVIHAKIWLIGRSYAAAVERRRKFRNIPNDDFYSSKVVPAFLARPEIDQMIEDLRRNSLDDPGILTKSAYLHKFVVDILFDITGQEKRSLASKYLHFHLRKLFFIYDSRAEAAVRKALPGFRSSNTPEAVDVTYYRFVERCIALRVLIKQETNLSLDPRDIDTVLLRS